MKYKLLLVVLFFIGAVSLQAQLGILTASPQATLHIESQPLDPSVSDGIIAPKLTRGQLISKDSQYSVDQTNAIIYITLLDGVTTSKTAKVTKVGYYYFDGIIWQAFDGPGRYFYLPDFIIPTASIGTGKTFDLYSNVFNKQFNQAGNSDYNTSNAIMTQVPIARHNSASDFDYVITYYDTDVIKINSISPTGVVNYNVVDTLLGPGSFMNVVLITK